MKNPNSPLSFSVSLKDIEDRIDPPYYEPKHLNLLTDLKKTPVKITTLGKIAKLISKGSTPKEFKPNKDGILFLKAGNIGEMHINLNNVSYISTEIHTSMKKTQVRPCDILLTISGSIGNVTVVPENIIECNINQGIARIVLKENIDPIYVAAFLNSEYGRIQMMRKSHGMVQQNVTLHALQSIMIPIPSEEIQQKVVKKIKHSIDLQNLSEKLLAKAEKMLGISKYIRETVKRSYITMYDSLSDRLDAVYYLPKFNSSKITSEKYDIKPLDEVVEFSDEIVNPKKEPDNMFLYIEIGSISTARGYISIDSCKELPGSNISPRARKLLRAGDIVFSKVRPKNRAVAIIGDTIIKRFEEGHHRAIVGSTGFAVLRPTKDIIREYLHFVLRSTFFLRQVERYTHTGYIPGITEKDLAKIKIPIPPQETQKEIVDLISKSASAKEEARAILDDISKNFLYIITGEDVIRKINIKSEAILTHDGDVK